MESLTDMLVDTVDTEEECETIEAEDTPRANLFDDVEDAVPVKEKKAVVKDLFSLSYDEDAADAEQMHSFYTEPVDITKSVKVKSSMKDGAASLLISKPEDDTDDDIITSMPTKVETANVKRKVVERKEPEPESDDEVAEGSAESAVEEEAVDYPLPLPKDTTPGPKYCHCRYGESGVMVECEGCNEWYHDECIGLTEEETYNIDLFYCAPCASKDPSLETKYIKDPQLLREKIISDVKKEDKPKTPKVRKRSLSKTTTPKSIKHKTPKSINWIPNQRAGPLSSKKKTPSKTPIKKSPSKPKNQILNRGERTMPDKKTFSFGNDSSESSGDSEVEFNTPKKKKAKKEKSSPKDAKDKVAFLNCGECGEAVPNRQALARHMKKHVEKEPERHACDECPKVFGSARGLKEHQPMHSGIKPFSCMFCGESFYLMSQVTNHTNSKHLNVRHQCEHCSRSYSQRTGLLSHLKKNHSEEVDQDSD